MNVNPEFIEVKVPGCLFCTPLAVWVPSSVFSSGLLGLGDGGTVSKEDLFLWTLVDMGASWELLTVNELFVASVFLYNKGYRKEALLWYYVAWSRFEYLKECVEGSKGQADSILEEGALFCSGLKPWFFGYGYYHPDVFSRLLEGILDDLTRLRWEGVYPSFYLKRAEEQKEAAQAVSTHFSGLRLHSVNDSYFNGYSVEDSSFKNLSSECLPADFSGRGLK